MASTGKKWSVKRRPNFFRYVEDEISFFKQGLDTQRELYKYAYLHGDYDLMLKTIENIKTEIKTKAMRKGFEKKIAAIEKIINWYKELPLKHKTYTPEGVQYNFPEDIELRISRGLNMAYNFTMHILENLNLL